MYSNEKLTAKDIKKAAYEFGADLVGIGSINRWANVPAECDPKAIMPRAKSVICIGFRIHRGAYRGMEEGTYYSAYTLSGFNDLNNVIAPVVQRRLASFIEDYGYEATPVMYNSGRLGTATGEAAVGADGQPKQKPEVFFNFRVGAVLCGVGEIGKSRLLLTRKFGPAQRLYFILTEAELEEDPIITGICDGCGACIKACPAKALSSDKTDDIVIPGITTIHRCAIDPKKCELAHIHGAFSPFSPPEVREYAQQLIDDEDGKMPSPEEIKEKITDRVSYAANAKKEFGCPSALCAECSRACLAHLDGKGTLDIKFENRFREK